MHKLLVVAFTLMLFTGNTKADLSQYSPEKIHLPSLDAEPSNWHEFNKDLYSTLLSKQKGFDVLVLPFQVRDHAIDHIGRSLMSRYLISRLQDSGLKKIPELDLVEMAIGENERWLQPAQAFQLANRLKVKQFVLAYTGHNTQGMFTFSIRVYEKANAGDTFSAKTPYRQKDWNQLSFSDTRLPSDIFLQHSDEVARFITGKDPARPKAYSSPLGKKAISTPQQLYTKALRPLDTAYYLQLLGVLHPYHNPRKIERLFERSLLALNRVSDKQPLKPLLRARALFYLHRRPAGLESLKGLKNTPEVVHMRSMLNGNLPQMENTRKKIKHPLLRFLARFEYHILFQAYNNIAPDTLSQPYLFPGDAWSMLIARKLSDLNPWQIQSNLIVKAALDKAFPLPGDTAQSRFTSQLLQGSKGSDNTFVVTEHVHQLLKNQADDWCCSNNKIGLHKWDYLNILDAIGESNLLKALSLSYAYRGNLNQGIAISDHLDSMYQGHPHFASMKAKILYAQHQRANAIKKKALKQKINSLANNIIAWTNGQTRINQVAASHLYSKKFPKPGSDKSGKRSSFQQRYYHTDFPPRFFWDIVADMPLPQIKRFRGTQIAYASYDLFPLWKLNRELGAVRTIPTSYLKDRFIGNHSRVKLLSEIVSQTKGKQAEIQVYLEAVNNNSFYWRPYEQLAKFYITENQYDKAADIYSRFHLFGENRGKNTVEMSNYAKDAAEDFYFRGITDKAEKFFKLAAESDTGSGAQYNSQYRLALMQGDYGRAMEYALQNARRYGAAFSFSNFLSLLFAVGEEKAATEILGSIFVEKQSRHLIPALLVSQRIQEQAANEILDWVTQPHIAALQDQHVNLSRNIAFKALSMDRVVDNAALERFFKLGRTTAIHNENVKLYFALKRDQLEQQLKGPLLPIASLSIDDGYSDGFWMPYYVYLYAFNKTEKLPREFQKNAVEKYLNLIGGVIKDDRPHPVSGKKFNNHYKFNYRLSMAVLSASNNNHQAAQEHFNKAIGVRPASSQRPLSTWYQMVELALWLYQKSGEQSYLKLALAWSRTVQKIHPTESWAYAFEARYSKNQKAAIKALAIARYLDPHSHWASLTSPQLQQKATVWLQRHNPFAIKQELKSL